MKAIDKTYKTSDVAEIIGIHPNTVRMYEDWGIIKILKSAVLGMPVGNLISTGMYSYRDYRRMLNYSD